MIQNTHFDIVLGIVEGFPPYFTPVLQNGGRRDPRTSERQDIARRGGWRFAGPGDVLALGKTIRGIDHESKEQKAIMKGNQASGGQGDQAVPLDPFRRLPLKERHRKRKAAGQLGHPTKRLNPPSLNLHRKRGNERSSRHIPACKIANKSCDRVPVLNGCQCLQPLKV